MPNDSDREKMAARLRDIGEGFIAGMAGDSDYDRFEMMSSHVRVMATAMIEEFFGNRDGHDGEEAMPHFCEICRRWKLLDELTANPFSE